MEDWRRWRLINPFPPQSRCTLPIHCTCTESYIALYTYGTWRGRPEGTTGRCFTAPAAAAAVQFSTLPMQSAVCSTLVVLSEAQPCNQRALQQMPAMHLNALHCRTLNIHLVHISRCHSVPAPLRGHFSFFSHSDGLHNMESIW